MRRLQTDVPPRVLRSSGSRVRLPVMTTRLMFVAAISRCSLSLCRSIRRRPARVHPATAGMSARGREVAGMSAGIRGIVTKGAGALRAGPLGALGRGLDVLGNLLRLARAPRALALGGLGWGLGVGGGAPRAPVLLGAVAREARRGPGGEPADHAP